MRRTTILVAAAIILALVLGCFRTRYVNFVDPQQAPTVTQKERIATSRWRSFWIFGWAPGEQRLDASAACGGIDHIDSIETRRTFAQGAIAAVAGYYINIYSPYTGWVVCDDDPGRRPSS